MMIINRLKSKLHRNTKGFTLAEVLITVAIIIVLMAVAAPNLIQHQKSLKRMELNKTAQEIFLAVQNTMTDIKSAGTLEDLMKDSGVTESGSDNKGAAKGIKLYSFGSDSPFYKQCISNPALSVISGGFSVEFYKETCEVYRVIYAEDAETYNGLLDAANAGSSLDGYPAMEKTGSYGENAPTLPSDYYDQDEKIVLDYLSVSNEDTLSLSLRFKDPLDYAASIDNLTISITYTDTAGNSVKISDIKDGSGASYDSGKQTFTIMLDNINEANRVQFYSDKPNLVKGANVTAAVDIVYKNGNDERHLDTKESNYKVSFNPLFDSATDGETIYVSCLRHLINLNLKDLQSDDFQPKLISQVNPIDVTYNSLFAPIGLNIEYDGNNQAIKNLPATMFASRSENISNVIITDPKISVEKGPAAALVQKQTGGTISNCRAYVVTGIPDNYKNYGVSGTGSVGGLIASAENAEIINSFAAINVTGNVNVTVGGFAGKLTNCTVTNCYSSGEVINNGSGSAGGFVAEASGSGIFRSCYSTSDVGTNSTMSVNAGGFAYKASGTLTYCYSFGRLIDLSHKRDDKSLDKSEYAGAIDLSGTGEYFGFSDAEEGVDYSSCYFLRRGYDDVSIVGIRAYTSNNGYNEYVDDAAGKGQDYWYFAYAKGDEARAAVPYDNSLNKHELAFPFEISGFPSAIPHYGNWPHDYVISDHPVGTKMHQYVCTICGNTYDYPCHIMDNYCDVCEKDWGA